MAPAHAGSSGNEPSASLGFFIWTTMTLADCSEHPVGEFVDQKGWGGEAYPPMKEAIVPQCQGLRYSLFVIELPFKNHRRIHDELRGHYLRLPSRMVTIRSPFRWGYTSEGYLLPGS